jgi:hypothetical protein
MAPAAEKKIGEMNSVRSYAFNPVCARDMRRSLLGGTRPRGPASVAPDTIRSEVRQFSTSPESESKKAVDVEV